MIRHPVPALLLLLGGCSSGSVPDARLALSQDQHCPARLQRGETLQLELPADPASGYRWFLRENSAELLQQLGPEQLNNSTSHWRFRAIHRGTGRLILGYRPAREAGTDPDDLFDCRIIVE